MEDPDLLLTLYREVRWLIVMIGVLMLGVALYKLLWVHEESNNGRITSRLQMPHMSPHKPVLPVTIRHKQYTRQQLKLFSIIYLTQQILFSLILFSAGLSLCLLWWFDIGHNRPLDVIIPLLGMLLMVAGICSSIFRDRGNPFRLQ